MMDRIGVQRKWIQHKGTRHEHFDICKSKRAFAIQCGAIPITGLELAEMCLDKGRTREGYYQSMPRTAVFVVAGSREEYRISRCFAGLYTASYILSPKRSFEQSYDRAILFHGGHRGADKWCVSTLDFNNWGWEAKELKVELQDKNVDKQFSRLFNAAEDVGGDLICVAFPLISLKREETNTQVFMRMAKNRGHRVVNVPPLAGELFKDRLPSHYT